MALFDISKTEKPKKDLTMLQIAESKFGDDKSLMKEIRKFLLMCKQNKCLPTKISFKEQCEILEKLPKQERIKAVHRSVLNGYRQMAYENEKEESNITRKKVDKSKIRKDLAF